MVRLRWLHELVRRWIPQNKRRGKGHRPPTWRRGPCVETLEERVVPTISLSVTAPSPLPEGDSGTSNMVFAIMRSGDLTPSFSVSYTTQDGTAIACTDYVATSG